MILNIKFAANWNCYKVMICIYRKFNTPNRINQAAQILYKSLHNTVESFGLPLPVLVTETLTFADSE